MVRILHTADWHIGQTLRGFSREFEHRKVFDRIARIIALREIDVIIVSGDIFDAQNPSGDALRLFYETLAHFRSVRPALSFVILAGNHDSAVRLEAPKPFLASFNIHVVGNIRRAGGVVDAERHLIPVADAKGHVAAHVLAVSYPTAACLPNLPRLEDETGSLVVRAVATLYADLVEQLRPRFQGLPLIGTGHLHVAGGTESEGAERRILVGGQHAVPPDIFPEDFCYMALGHLHKAQTVGRETIRYSGSLFPLSATEQPYRHGVSVVTIGDDGRSVQVEHVPIDRPVPFLRLPGDGDLHLADLGDHFAALDLAADLPLEERPFLQIRLAREGLSPGFREEIDRVAEGFPVRVVEVKLQALPQAPTMGDGGTIPVRLAERAPEEMFRLAFEREFQTPPEAAHMEVFHRVQAEI
ncbi:exonuclease SbcCD subunit D [Telmatospirillum siberiense]|uniref:Nuclease SbcCD subunit D n=1 Tax=Telmatospirillum siberiense TaxID=382514 RepID=A0A2N3PQM7_9PROT|nr:exonuclease SbcCD subunit D [Telmatospirillum siberiense]PKU22715.1 exonuclease SbcCD subunit D [Telmatospirillum siberiense]